MSDLRGFEGGELVYFGADKLATFNDDPLDFVPDDGLNSDDMATRVAEKLRLRLMRVKTDEISKDLRTLIETRIQIAKAKNGKLRRTHFVPNPNGRHGGKDHQEVIAAIFQELQDISEVVDVRCAFNAASGERAFRLDNPAPGGQKTVYFDLTVALQELLEGGEGDLETILGIQTIPIEVGATLIAKGLEGVPVKRESLKICGVQSASRLLLRQISYVSKGHPRRKGNECVKGNVSSAASLALGQFRYVAPHILANSLSTLQQVEQALLAQELIRQGGDLDRPMRDKVAHALEVLTESVTRDGKKHLLIQPRRKAA